MSSKNPFADQREAVRSAAMAGETVRIGTKGATRAWMILFIPGGAALFVLLCYVLQKATGLPFYDVLGLGECTPSTMNSDDEDAKARCLRERDQYSSSQRGVARIAILIAVAVIAYFVYEQFEGGLGGGLFGGSASNSPVLQMRPVLRDASEHMMMTTQQNLEVAQMHQLPMGAADASYMTNSPQSIAGQANLISRDEVRRTSAGAPALAQTFVGAPTRPATDESIAAYGQQVGGFDSFVPGGGRGGGGRGGNPLDVSMNIG